MLCAFMQPVISVSNLSKTYASGFQALKNVDLEIRRGEIFALLGPNGAGKTTLISIVCGIVNADARARSLADGHDIVARLPRRAREDRPRAAGADHRRLRDRLGHGELQPRPVRQAAEPGPHREGAARPVAVGQEGQQDHDAVRRHEAPGADRQGARRTSRRSCSSTSRPPASTSSCGATCGSWCARCATTGVTIILTTHYIEEAEEMADRIGVINKGELILVEDKAELMRKLGKKQLTLQLQAPLAAVPDRARGLPARARRTTATELDLHLRRPGRAHRHRRAAAASSPSAGIGFKDLQTEPELARGHLRQPGEGAAHEPARGPRDLLLRDGAHLAARCCRASSRR